MVLFQHVISKKNEVRYFILFFMVSPQNLVCVFIDSTSQFRQATFQVANRHMQLVAVMLDHTALKEFHVGRETVHESCYSFFHVPSIVLRVQNI